MMHIAIRRAIERDQSAIRSLIKSERLNSGNVNWKGFYIALDSGDVIGAAQMRLHKDNSRELRSLIVATGHRGRGVADRLISAVLANEPGHVFAITGRANNSRCEQWGFRPTDPRKVPAHIRRDYLIGQVGDRLLATLKRRPANPMRIYERQTLPHRRREEFLAAQWF